MTRARRTIGILAATAMAGALPVLVASPAQASFTDCTNYMRNMGYRVGPNVQNACSNGESGLVGKTVCWQILVNVGVPVSHADEACYQAAR
ncbi:hypothetical protein [Streptomyces katrae]|uniref:hypothetical protein n=1 Tax=Streptomyces katrae TaxID=68223 RepID=UPI000B228552|nr:hypothetical protein [Streptomyces katrae]